MAIRCYCSDGIVFTLFPLLIIDLHSRWNQRTSCEYPIYIWILGFYVSVITFRLFRLFSSFLLSLRITKVCILFKLIIILPAYFSWTVLGIYWHIQNILKSGQCIPPCATILDNVYMAHGFSYY